MPLIAIPIQSASSITRSEANAESGVGKQIVTDVKIALHSGASCK